MGGRTVTSDVSEGIPSGDAAGGRGFSSLLPTLCRIHQQTADHLQILAAGRFWSQFFQFCPNFGQEINHKLSKVIKHGLLERPPDDLPSYGPPLSSGIFQLPSLMTPEGTFPIHISIFDS